MSGEQYINIQRRLLYINEQGHTLTQEQLERALDGLLGAARNLVRINARSAYNVEGIMPPPPMRTVPQFVDVILPTIDRTRPVAELRPVAEPVTEPDRMANFVLSSRLFKVETILKREMNKNCDNVCAICLETHKKGNSFTTECCHEFGRDCYINWIYSTNGNQACPTCRKSNPKVTMYKYRGQKTRDV